MCIYIYICICTYTHTSNTLARCAISPPPRRARMPLATFRQSHARPAGADRVADLLCRSLSHSDLNMYIYIYTYMQHSRGMLSRRLGTLDRLYQPLADHTDHRRADRVSDLFVEAALCAGRHLERLWESHQPRALARSEEPRAAVGRDSVAN